MPCQDDYPPGYDEGYKSGASEVVLLRKRNDELARLLCEACYALEKSGGFQCFTSKLKTWWDAHSRFDRKEGR